MPSPGRSVTRYDRVPEGVPLVLRRGAAALWGAGAEGAAGALVRGALTARPGEGSEGEEEEGLGVGVAFARTAARGRPAPQPGFRAGLGVLSAAPAGQSAADAIASDEVTSGFRGAHPQLKPATSFPLKHLSALEPTPPLPPWTRTQHTRTRAQLW